MPRLLYAAFAALTIAALPVETSQRQTSAFPARLKNYLTGAVKTTAEERKRLSDGAPVVRMLPTDESKEVAVFGAIWINAPIQRYVDAVSDIENFEKGGGFTITKRISAPPRLEDFGQLHLPPEDIDDLRTCRVGDCAVKLGEPALQRLRKEINWNEGNARQAVDALMQRLAFEYVNGYLKGGNEQLAVYRDSSRPTFVAREFRTMIDQMPGLTAYLPNVRRYLLEYPNVTMQGVTSLLYWQETQFGLKPTIRINHLMIRKGLEDTVVASKMLYASHYFWTGLELRALVPDATRGAGFWFVMVNRSRSDGLGGFTGAFVRGRVRGEVEQGARAGLEATKQRLEVIGK